MASRFTPAEQVVVRAKVIEYLKKGATYKNAAQAALISPQTLYNWRQEEGFNEQCEEARASVTITVTEALLNSCRDGNSSSIQFYLQRMGGEEWAGQMDKTMLDALIQILAHITNSNGLLPPTPTELIEEASTAMASVDSPSL